MQARVGWCHIEGIGVDVWDLKWVGFETKKRHSYALSMREGKGGKTEKLEKKKTQIKKTCYDRRVDRDSPSWLAGWMALARLVRDWHI
jgi:hypothetical protein